MADNYVQRKKYDGLKEGKDGQIELKTVDAPEEDFVTATPDEEEARKNGGGARRRRRNTVDEEE